MTKEFLNSFLIWSPDYRFLTELLKTGLCKKSKRNKLTKKYSPQNGIPSGAQLPLSHTLLDGPKSSNPLSHAYVATAPFPNDSSVNVTVLWAGEPGKLHDCAENKREIYESVLDVSKIIWWFFLKNLNMEDTLVKGF